MTTTEPDEARPRPLEPPATIGMLAFFSVLAWMLAVGVAILKWDEYRNEFAGGFIDPVLFDLVPYLVVAVGLTCITLVVAVAYLTAYARRVAGR